MDFSPLVTSSFDFASAVSPAFVLALASAPYEVVDALMRWTLLGWLVCVGAAAGSFLNVVVYRLPAGLSVVRPASRCPYCLHPIRLRDNVPVLGWLALGGRCRDCAAPIAGRYPAVEAAAAGLTAIVASFVLRPIDMLPLRPSLLALDAPPADWQAVLSFTVQLLALLTLFSGALMEGDGERPPLRLFLPALLLGALAALLVPPLPTAPALAPRFDLPVWSGPWLATLVGAGAGSFIGRWLPVDGREDERRAVSTLALALVGLVWGPTAVAAAGAATAAAVLLWRLSGRLDRPPLPPLGAAAATAVGLIVAAGW